VFSIRREEVQRWWKCAVDDREKAQILFVDFLCYTPEEFKKFKRQVTLVSEAVRKGKEI